MGDRILMCGDCGDVWPAWVSEQCLFHVWVGTGRDQGRQEYEQHCVACGEVRLVARL